MKHTKKHAIRDDLRNFAIRALLIFSVGLFVSFFGTDSFALKMEAIIRHPARISQLTAQYMIGLTLFLVGFVILITAQISLGRSYSSTLVIREDHQLITHGIYSLVRHPKYLGVIQVSIGMPVSS